MNTLAEHARTREPIRFDVAWTVIPAAVLLFVGLGLASCSFRSYSGTQISTVPVHAGIDDVLRERIQEEAREDKRLAGAQVVVRVQKHDVILSGRVRLYLQKMLYEQIAWHTQGVGEVDNEIQVVPEVRATDDEIKAIITHLLMEHEQFHAVDTAVQVKEGHVRLSATFREPGDVLVLKHRVAQIEGVVAIDIDATIIAQTNDTGVWTP